MEPSAEHLAAEKGAVVHRIKSYIGVMRQDKRMRTMAEILLREIERIEQEEAAKTARRER